MNLRSRLTAYLPEWADVTSRLRILAMVAAGGLLLAPLVARLPMAGWDWFFFFSRHNPTFNILSPTSAYPPYARYFIQLLTWMDWRDSLALLNSLTLVTLAVAVWRAGGRYGSIALALTSPCVWFLLWIGHPDGLALLGAVTGLIPLALIKPQLTVWTMFTSRRWFVWTVLFLGATLMVWPGWPLQLKMATFTHEAAFGWVITGWPVAVVGAVLFLGAGRDPYRLIAAGLLMSPYLMPYNFAILVPAIGQARGGRKVLIWAASWLVALGLGLGGPWKLLNLIFPLLAYGLNHSFPAYRANLQALMGRVTQPLARTRRAETMRRGL